MNSKLLLCLALVLSGYCRATIIFPAAPEEGRQIAYEKVGGDIQKFPKVFHGVKLGELSTIHPYPMYAIGTQDIAQGRLLSAAKHSGWLYLFLHGTDAVCGVPLRIDPKDGKLSTRGGVYTGGLVRGAWDGLRKADELPQVKKQDYEFRYTTCGFISFYAIWLHGKSEDIIFPLPPTYGKMKAYQPYSEQEITKLLRPEAENILSASKQYPHLPE
jgi:hypothetical protein